MQQQLECNPVLKTTSGGGVACSDQISVCIYNLSSLQCNRQLAVLIKHLHMRIAGDSLLPIPVQTDCRLEKDA